MEWNGMEWKLHISNQFAVFVDLAFKRLFRGHRTNFLVALDFVEKHYVR